MSDSPRTDTETLAAAMRILSVDIQSGDGVANAAIAEAAERLMELHEENQALREAYADELWRIANL